MDRAAGSGEKNKIISALDSILDIDFAKKFKDESHSMFTQAFIDDCILIFRELKKVPR